MGQKVQLPKEEGSVEMQKREGRRDEEKMLVSREVREIMQRGQRVRKGSCEVPNGGGKA